MTMSTRQKVYSVLTLIVTVLVLCLLIGWAKRLAYFLIVVAAFYVAARKFNFMKPEKILVPVVLALFAFFVVFPGIATHVWHKRSAYNFHAVMEYLQQRGAGEKSMLLWNASAIHHCDVSLMHDFMMSEVLRYYQIRDVTFVPGPQYPREDCVEAVQIFKDWQTRFYPASLRAYDEGIRVDKSTVLTPESNLKKVDDIIKKSGKENRLVYSAPAGEAWGIFYYVISSISRYVADDAPGYFVLEIY